MWYLLHTSVGKLNFYLDYYIYIRERAILLTRALVKVFCITLQFFVPAHFFLCIPVSHHHCHFQTSGHNSVKGNDKIIPLFYSLVKFFVPLHSFPIPFEVLLWNSVYLLVTIIPTSRQVLTNSSYFIIQLLSSEPLNVIYYSPVNVILAETVARVNITFYQWI
jgi:hypothetical protein